MSVVLQGQIFTSNAWGEASVAGGNTATVIEQFSYSVALSGTLATGDTVSLVEQNAAHKTLTLTCTGLGNSSAFVLQDGTGNDFLFSNAQVGIGDQAAVSTSGLQQYAPPPPCFALGTRIRTREGEVGVEALRAGDLVATASGRHRRVVWIGFRNVQLRNHPHPHDVLPVRVRAHAMAPGVPHRDVVLSPDHAVYLDGVLIPVRYLTNGATIRQEQSIAVTYFHLELDRHDILLAEGLPAESYLDTGNRNAFSNVSGAVTLHADFAHGAWAVRGCAPLVLDGPQLRATKERLLARACSLGHVQTDDPELRMIADGVTYFPDRTGDTYRFRLPKPATTLRLVSRWAIPAEMRTNTDDCRRLGVAVAGLSVNGHAVHAGDACQSVGWHAPEGDWRWTDGDATLHWPGAREVALTSLPLMRYWQVPFESRVSVTTHARGWRRTGNR
jgi:hypothetical protein